MAPAPSLAPGADRESRRRQILAAQVELLYANLNLAVGITPIAAVILGLIQWPVAPHPRILYWCAYMFLLSCGRFVLGRRYRSDASAGRETGRLRAAFVLGTGLTGVGWGLAGVLLYPETSPIHQTLLVFILGGMMLGGASLLAPLREAFLPFMLPTGLAPSLSLAIRGDTAHMVMGFLAGLFTVATIVTTWRLHSMIVSSLELKFENQNLVEDLQAAKNRAESLNEQLEVRVKERTAELHRSAEQLRAEIAHREQVEEELLRTRKLESLAILAGGIAHDFNNFLTMIQGNVEWAQMRLDLTEPVRAALGETLGVCRRAAILASQLLTFAKGGDPVRRLSSVAQLVTEEVRLASTGPNSNITLTIADDLHSAEIDPRQMSQALQNILLNAKEAVPAGGLIEVRAENATRVRDAQSDNFVRISIRDCGCGIPPDHLARLFDPYFTTKPGASGLGLATAYAIITKHGGSLSVESQVGVGSVFTIELPASSERHTADVARPAPTPTENARIASGRILVMDDENSLRKLLYGLLTNFGYEVQTARDGVEAIGIYENARARGLSFDAILLDLTVAGGMGGVETAARLQELDPSLHLIVSSGYSDSPVMSDFRKYGFSDVLPKPWTAAELREVFRRAIRR